MTTIEPEPGVVLIQLPTSEFGDIPVPVKPHDSITWGKVLGINSANEDKSYLVGRIIYFRKFKDDARFGNNLCLIDITDIMGSSYDSDS